MPPFLVTWKVDIEADSPLDAALAAVAIQRRPDTSAVVFDVRDKATGVEITIDLEPDDDCRRCNCRGWDIVHADPATGEPGEVQRCDECNRLPGDSAACEAARALGIALGDECQILEVPPGFTLAAFRDGSWPDPSAATAPPPADLVPPKMRFPHSHAPTREGI